MKTKLALAIFLSLSSTSLFAYYGGDYCQFNGLSNDPEHAEEEFVMLLESKHKPNFQTMGDVIGILTLTPIETLKNPSCKISDYAKKLLMYYKKHEVEIANNDQDIAELLGIIQKRLESDDPTFSKTEKILQNEL